MNTQRGSALLYTLSAIAFSSALVAVISTIMTQSTKEQKIFEKQMERNLLAKNLIAQLLNPSVIRASLDAPTTNPGNQVLRNCLSTDRANISGACAVSNPSDGMEFELTPEANWGGTPGYTYKVFFRPKCSVSPPVCADTSGLKNSAICRQANGTPTCCSLSNYADSASCVSSGLAPICSGGIVASCSGYTAICPQTTCAFAPSIDFRYELRPIPAAAGTVKAKDFQLGVYPSPANKDSSWVTLASQAIAGLECNEGAVATTDGSTGTLACRCSQAYQAYVDSSGSPVFNARGPVCKKMDLQCPPGFTAFGRDVDNKPICELTKNAIAKVNLSPYSSDNIGDVRTCPHNGWVSNINRYCSGSVAFVIHNTPGEFNWLPVILGFVIGVIVACAAVIALAIAFPPDAPLAIFALTALLAIAFSEGAGTIIGWILAGQPKDNWAYTTDDGSGYPDATCVTQIECSYFK